MPRMHPAQHPLPIHQKVTAQLLRIPPVTIQRTPLPDGTGVISQVARSPRLPERALQTKGMVSDSPLIQQQRKRRLRLLQPDAQPLARPKRDCGHVQVVAGQFGPVLRQLRNMIAAGQSAQVAQEDEQGAPAGLPQSP